VLAVQVLPSRFTRDLAGATALCLSVRLSVRSRIVATVHYHISW